MDYTLALEYLTFTFLTSFATLQIIFYLKKRNEWIIFNKLTFVWIALILISFVWFFSTRERNVQTYLEGGQLSVIFTVGAVITLYVTKIIKKV